jgi:gas vesicle structural protein
MSATPRIDAEEVTLLELLDRVIDRGVYLSGDITISVADVELIYLGLKLMLTSTERAEQIRASAAARSRGDLPRD